jgi:hypothetical protein
LGERYIIIRLLRRTDLPKLRGSDEFTRQILRFAWHLTSVAWLGLAAILVYFGLGRDEHSATVPQIIAVTFAVHAVVTFAASRGRHYAWIVFGGIAIVAYVGSWA